MVAYFDVASAIDIYPFFEIDGMVLTYTRLCCFFVLLLTFKYRQ